MDNIDDKFDVGDSLQLEPDIPSSQRERCGSSTEGDRRVLVLVYVQLHVCRSRSSA